MEANLTYASARTKKCRRNALKWLGPATLVALLFVAAPVSVRAEDATLVNPDKMKWVPLDAVPGTEIAVLSGDPSKQGMFVIEWRGPAGTKAAPHWHTNTELVAQISGNALVGMGDDVDLEKGMPLAHGGFGSMPAKMHHWYVAQSPFVVLIEGEGPFDVNFIHPEDDPRTKTSKK
jgi:hypothetical protein